MKMPRGNRGLKSPEFLEKMNKPQDGYQGLLSKNPLAVVVPIEIDAAIRRLPQKAAWLRRVITEAAQRELIKDGEV
jgi:hypothetical protein